MENNQTYNFMISYGEYKDSTLISCSNVIYKTKSNYPYISQKQLENLREEIELQINDSEIKFMITNIIPLIVENN